MIQNHKKLRLFEDALARRERPDFLHNLRIYEGLYQEAVHLGVLPQANPLQGIENNIKLARILNRV